MEATGSRCSGRRVHADGSVRLLIRRVQTRRSCRNASGAMIAPGVGLPTVSLPSARCSILSALSGQDGYPLARRHGWLKSGTLLAAHAEALAGRRPRVAPGGVRRALSGRGEASARERARPGERRWLPPVPLPPARRARRRARRLVVPVGAFERSGTEPVSNPLNLCLTPVSSGKD